MRVAVSIGLAALLVGVGASASAHEPAPARPPEIWGAVPVSVGLVRFVHIGELNDSLAAAGRARLGELMPSLGIAMRLDLPKRLFVEPGYRFVVAEAGEATFMSHHFLANLGWAAVMGGDARLAPVVGAGLAVTTLEVAEPARTSESFDNTLRSPRGEALLSATTLLLHAGIAADVWRSGRGEFLGLRAGALLDPLQPPWKRRGAALLDAPQPPVTGAYFAAAFGFELAR